ncbi:MAG: hypothetical protein ACRDRP_16855 [Pseudonocardiaceae bacterium]
MPFRAFRDKESFEPSIRYVTMVVPGIKKLFYTSRSAVPRPPRWG